MVEYFTAGCKNDELLGLELEHFVVRHDTGLSLPYEGGVEEILKRLQPVYGEPTIVNGRIIGIMREGAYITIEPAAQLEVSIGPCKEVSDIGRIYKEFTDKIAPILDEFGCGLVCTGYHPKSKIDTLPTIPKPRYDAMYKYFATVGTHGRNMMKGSAATQISIDIANEGDFKKKFRVANILSPIFSLMCDNTKVFEGEPYQKHMARTHIWNNVDPDRAMIVKNALDKDFGFLDYAKWVYDSPAIIAMDNGEVSYVGKTPVSALFENRKMDTADIEQVLSMMFPDVCLKNHLEIRMADSMPIENALAYTALIKGIFYDSANLDMLYERTLDIKNQDVAHAKVELIEKGKSGFIYGKSAVHWIDEMFKRTGVDKFETVE